MGISDSFDGLGGGILNYYIELERRAASDEKKIEEALDGIRGARALAGRIARYIPFAPLRKFARAAAIEGWHMARYRKTARRKFREDADMVRNNWEPLEASIKRLESIVNEEAGLESADETVINYVAELGIALSSCRFTLHSLEAFVSELQELWAETYGNKFPYSLKQEPGLRAAP